MQIKVSSWLLGQTIGGVTGAVSSSPRTNLGYWVMPKE